MAAFAISANAQLVVDEDGNVNIKMNTDFSMNYLSVGLAVNPINYSNYSVASFNQRTINSYKYNIGVIGDASHLSGVNINSGRSFGVIGEAGYSTSGYNYGIYGSLLGTQNGAGIYGTISQNMGDYVDGRYAGYFKGATYVDGTLTATSVITPSDIRLKENIVPFSNMDRGNTLENVLNMNVIEYSYKQRPVPEAERDSVNERRCEDPIQNDRHYGLSAQELQAIYPNLVKEGQDGYLGVNYVELVPVLIRAIQELKGELDAVKGSGSAARKVPATTSVSTASLSNGNVLYQNTPNPFKEQTTIRFSLADDARDASICIFDMTGKMLKNLPISSGETSVCVGGWELGEGMFLYTLIVNGKEIDTKRMIITR